MNTWTAIIVKSELGWDIRLYDESNTWQGSTKYAISLKRAVKKAKRYHVDYSRNSRNSNLVFKIVL